jgi:hypothetical protein
MASSVGTAALVVLGPEIEPFRVPQAEPSPLENVREVVFAVVSLTTSSLAISAFDVPWVTGRDTSISSAKRPTADDRCSLCPVGGSLEAKQAGKFGALSNFLDGVPHAGVGRDPGGA